jgi:hypothetical protein
MLRFALNELRPSQLRKYREEEAEDRAIWFYEWVRHEPDLAGPGRLRELAAEFDEKWAREHPRGRRLAAWCRSWLRLALMPRVVHLAR